MLRDDINKALTEAMKAKNERAVSTLRMVNSTLKNADIEARTTGKPLDDAAVLSILQKMIKQRQESVDLYQKGGRADLVKQEQEEIAIISAYLPQQMSEDEMNAAIDAAMLSNRPSVRPAALPVRTSILRSSLLCSEPLYAAAAMPTIEPTTPAVAIRDRVNTVDRALKVFPTPPKVPLSCEPCWMIAWIGDWPAAIWTNRSFS